MKWELWDADVAEVIVKVRLCHEGRRNESLDGSFECCRKRKAYFFG
jgi:hypothetical protein